jgi:hypothetical protein
MHAQRACVRVLLILCKPNITDNVLYYVRVAPNAHL